jgi:hypothetical protein
LAKGLNSRVQLPAEGIIQSTDINRTQSISGCLQGRQFAFYKPSPGTAQRSAGQGSRFFIELVKKHKKRSKPSIITD